MVKSIKKSTRIIGTISAGLIGFIINAPSLADGGTGQACTGLPTHTDLSISLSGVVTSGGNGGLGNDMWATVVNRDGTVCAVARSSDLGNQWPGSRVISAQKANTANAFSLEGNYPNILVPLGRALSSGNLYGTVLPDGSLLGLQFSNPVDTKVAYDGKAKDFGTLDDPMVGKRIGGVNVFGGGLALYDLGGELIGGLGVSGDTSCADHVIAWRVRDDLALDNIPGGISTTGDDNLIIVDPPTPNSFEHPSCINIGTTVDGLPANYPIPEP